MNRLKINGIKRIFFKIKSLGKWIIVPQVNIVLPSKELWGEVNPVRALAKANKVFSLLLWGGGKGCRIKITLHRAKVTVPTKNHSTKLHCVYFAKA